jgi:hypothetical protein
LKGCLYEEASLQMDIMFLNIPPCTFKLMYL